MPAKRTPGRKFLYGERAVPHHVTFPPDLLDKVRAEAAWRSAKEGHPGAWSVSRLVVDILLDHFEMPKPQ